jgi:hypothetical protein
MSIDVFSPFRKTKHSQWDVEIIPVIDWNLIHPGYLACPPAALNKFLFDVEAQFVCEFSVLFRQFPRSVE